MYSPSRPAVFAAGALLALAVVPASSALASGGDDAHEAGHHGLLLKSSLAGSLRADAPVFGVHPGGLDWVLDEGTARVDSAGHLEVEIEGLMIPALGKNPVAMVTVSLLCNGVIAGTTAPAPLSVPAGNAEIEARVSVPARCLAPVVMVNPVNPDFPKGNVGVFIAISGQEA